MQISTVQERKGEKIKWENVSERKISQWRLFQSCFYKCYPNIFCTVLIATLAEVRTWSHSKGEVSYERKLS